MTGLTNGTSYTFTVTAHNIAGDGAASARLGCGDAADRARRADRRVRSARRTAQASVSFSAPSSNGGAAITSYTVTSSPGGKTATGAGSPLVVTGLTNGTSYTFTVTAHNVAGDSAASRAFGCRDPARPCPARPRP